MHSKQTKEFAKAHADGCCRDEPAGVPHQLSEGVGLSVASPPVLRLCYLPFPCLMFLLSAHHYLEHVYVWPVPPSNESSMAETLSVSSTASAHVTVVPAHSRCSINMLNCVPPKDEVLTLSACECDFIWKWSLQMIK